jgi:hypothetical protein
MSALTRQSPQPCKPVVSKTTSESMAVEERNIRTMWSLAIGAVSSPVPVEAMRAHLCIRRIPSSNRRSLTSPCIGAVWAARPCRQSNSYTADHVSPTRSRVQRQKRSNGTKYCGVDRRTRRLSSTKYVFPIIASVRGTMSPYPWKVILAYCRSALQGPTLSAWFPSPAALAIVKSQERVIMRAIGVWKVSLVLLEGTLEATQ